MTIVLPIALPSLASVTVWGLIIALTGYFGYHAGRLVEQRANDAYVRRAAAQMVNSPWWFPGSPMMEPSAVDPRETIWCERRWYQGPYPGEEGYAPTDQDEPPFAVAA